jgi:hypothetical protein
MPDALYNYFLDVIVGGGIYNDNIPEIKLKYIELSLDGSFIIIIILNINTVNDTINCVVNLINPTLDLLQQI